MITEPLPEVSLVLCTRNRARYLPQTLAYFEEIQSLPTWELVIVDNGSSDATPQILREFERRTSITVRAVTEPRPGLSRARNAGWKHSRAEVLAFTDDDCYPRPDFVARILQSLDERALDYIGGRVVLHDPADYPITLQLRDTPLDIPPGSFIQAGTIHGANMAMRRTVFNEVGGFDELLGAGTPLASGEDCEFLNRASAAGFVGGYDPRPTVSHHHRRRTPAEADGLRRSYALGRGAFYMACLLDRRRRLQAAKAWYWSARGILNGPGGRSAAALIYVRELRGALRYFLSDRARRIRRALFERDSPTSGNRATTQKV